MIWLIRRPVPTGTVDLITTTLEEVINRAASRTMDSTPERSAEPSARGGVPTAMKMT